MHVQISLSSKEPISLEERKKYIDRFYSERMTYQKEKHRNLGFIHKFNNAIGFKNVVGFSDNTGVYYRPLVESPDAYQSPKALLYEHMWIGFDSPNAIVEFILPKQKMNHPVESYSYNTALVAEKFYHFLQKVFPELLIEKKEIEDRPAPSLFEFSRDFFFKSLEKEIAVTAEFSSKEMLQEEEMKELLRLLQPLTNDEIGIAQFPCDTCLENSKGENPIHIEIVYLTWYGKDIRAKTIEEYGDQLVTL